MSNALKTKPSNTSVASFIASIDTEQKQNDCKQLINIMQKITGEKPKLWGGKMIGFSEYHYKYASGHEGDWFITGFATRKQGLTVYIMPGFSNYDDLMQQLGKYKNGKSCLYIKSLSDININILTKLIQQSVDYMINKYKPC